MSDPVTGAVTGAVTGPASATGTDPRARPPRYARRGPAPGAARRPARRPSAVRAVLTARALPARALVAGVLTARVLGACAEPSCGPATGEVARVLDGDTVELVGGLRVRYLLVDAPELTAGHPACYAANAAAFHRDLVLGRALTLTYDAVCTDAHGRLLAFAAVDGVDVNRALVERGYARVLHLPPAGDAAAPAFRALEAAARAAGRGLWGACPAQAVSERPRDGL